MNNHDCTRKIEQYRFYKTDAEICKILGISPPTLYVRLKRSNWKVSEVFLIESLRL